MSNLKRFNIEQSKLEQEKHVPAALISKLYTLVNSQNLSGNSYDTENTTIIGNISTGYTYDNYIETLREAFPNLIIEYEGLYLHFVDSEVEQTILNNANKFVPSGTTYDYEGVIDTLNLGTDGFKQIFYNNQDITTFDELPKFKNLKSIGYQDFRECNNLKSVDLTNVESIYGNAFRYSYNLEYFNGLNSEKGSLILHNLKSTGLKPISNAGYTFCWDWDDNSSMYLGPKIIKIYDLGNCETIPASCFYGCQSLKYIAAEVFQRLKTIEHYAFFDCTNLVVDDLNLDNCTSIGNHAFGSYNSRGRAPQIKKISGLGTSCQIAEGAFERCDTLTTITTEAMANIKSIGRYAFNGCTSLLIEDLSLPSLTSISEAAFNNTKIKTISSLGNNINVVQGFNNCTMLTSVVLPLSATTLGESAFSGCTNLQLPANLLTQIKYFNNWCLDGVNGLPNILYLPDVTAIGLIPFPNTTVRTIYLPKLQHTNGIDGYSTPYVSRGEYIMRCGANMSIFYLKDINKINGWIFGGRNYCSLYTLDINADGWWNQNVDVVGRHYVDGHRVQEFKTTDSNGNPTPIPFLPKGQNIDYWGDRSYWSNIKYLVINRKTPPDYWQSVEYYSPGGGNCMIYCSFGLYQHATNGANRTFQYLAVPRTSIDTYLAWDAFHPDFSLVSDETDKQTFENVTKFDNTDTSNPRIIAIESMGHFKTKAEYDAAPDYPNNDYNHHKDEYLIEEYMGLGSNEFNWDPTPTWSI